MSEKRSTKSCFLVTLMLFSLIVPVMSFSVSAESDSNPESTEYDVQGVIIGDLANFDVNNGREYLMIDEETPVVSAYGFMKQAWIDAGMPGVDDMKFEPVTHGRV